VLLSFLLTSFLCRCPCCCPATAAAAPFLLQHGGDTMSRKERMMRQLGLKSRTDEELAEDLQMLQDDMDDDD
jgi:hypothetical protein